MQGRNVENMKKVLVITYYWPPSGGAGVQRWLKFTKYLPGFGWKPIIYTPENPEAPADDDSLQKDIHKDVIIIKRPIVEPYSWYKKLIGQKQSERINAGFLSESKKSGIKESIVAWVRGNLFIPDARKFWIKPSVRFLIDYLKENPVDVIISTGPPHSMHMIALGIKKRLKIPWIADFRDPWTGIDFYKDLKLTSWADRLHHQLERRVLTQADVVITVGKTAAVELTSLGKNNVKVITNGYDPTDFATVESSQSEKFTIVHVGAINKDRNHRVFWEGLSRFKEMNSLNNSEWSVKIVGKADYTVQEDINKFNLKDNVEFVSYIPHSEVLKLEENASVLYLSINNTPNAKGILTGKIFEYLAAKRPIIAIGPKDGDVADILNDTKSGLISDFENADEFVANLNEYFTKFKNRTLYVASVGIEKFSRKHLTEELSVIINEIC